MTSARADERGGRAATRGHDGVGRPAGRDGVDRLPVRVAARTVTSVVLLALALASATSGCGGCPRSRGAHAIGSHPSATELSAGAPIVVEATPGPPLLVELDEPTVHAVAASQAMDLRHCFEVARAEHPALSGRVALDVMIGADGAVHGAAVATNETGDGVLGACLVALAERWHFPSSPHGARVTLPFDVTDPPPAPQLETASPATGVGAAEGSGPAATEAE